MRRAVALALLVALSMVAGVGLADAATTSYISNVTVSPEQPAPGERFTVTTTIQNGEQSDTNLHITDVYVRQQGSTADVARVENLGTIPPGANIDVPLTASFDSPGTRELRVTVVGRASNDELVRLQYPVVVTVRQGGPQVSVSTPDAVVGAESRVRVTATNGEDEPVRNLRLRLSGTNASVTNTSRVLPTLASGESRTFRFNVTPESTAAELEAELAYTTATGDSRVVRDRAAMNPDPLRENVQVDADLGNGATPPVTVGVSNFGNAALEDVRIELVRNGSALASRSTSQIAPDGSRTIRFNLSDVGSGPLTARASYRTGGADGESSTSLSYAANPGQVELTGLDYEMEGGRLHISGSTSNVGLSTVDSVVVSVVETETVAPARPNPEYFVGSIPSSDFASFDLYAELSADAETVPVEVSYLVDGDRRTTRTEVDVSDLTADAEDPDAGGSGSGGGFPSLLLVAAGVVAVVVVVGVATYAYRRR